MTPLVKELAQYAAYHRDRRNIATHFVGIPMIVLAVQILLARPVALLGLDGLSPALLISVLALLWYLRLDRPLGLVMAVWLGAGQWIAHALAAGATATWLWAGGGLFVLGWVIQAIGHVYEGRKPAFLDDIRGLLVGPLFVAAEALFALGARGELKAAIEAQAGPTRVGRATAAGGVG